MDRHSTAESAAPTFETVSEVTGVKAKRNKLAVWDKESVWLGAEGVLAKEMARIDRRSGLHSMPKSLEKLLTLPEWKGSSYEHLEHTVELLPRPKVWKRAKGTSNGYEVIAEGPQNALVRQWALITHPCGATMRIDVLALGKK